MKYLVILALTAIAVGLALDPELLLQLFFRGGFLAIGIAMTLALRPRDEQELVQLPRAVLR